jgi:transposase
MATIYKVTLTDEERQTLGDIVSKGRHSAAKIKHANILLAVDESDGRVKRLDADIAKQFHCHYNTVTKIKQRFVEQGFEAALERKQRENPSIEPMFDGRKEAQLIQLACSPPPEGHCTWTLQLLADKCVELNIVEKTSDNTIQRVLKKTNYSLTRKNVG